MSVPVIGRTYRLQNADYMYGLGPLVVRVIKVIRRVEYGDGQEWYEVEGYCKRPNAHGPAHGRLLIVRGAAL
jgi:hypothetical protein